MQGGVLIYSVSRQTLAQSAHLSSSEQKAQPLSVNSWVHSPKVIFELALLETDISFDFSFLVITGVNAATMHEITMRVTMSSTREKACLIIFFTKNTP